MVEYLLIKGVYMKENFNIEELEELYYLLAERVNENMQNNVRIYVIMQIIANKIVKLRNKKLSTFLTLWFAKEDMLRYKISLKSWIEYFDIFMEAIDVNMLDSENILIFSQYLKNAKVEIKSPVGSEIYLQCIQEMDEMLITINCEQGQARR